MELLTILVTVKPVPVRLCHAATGMTLATLANQAWGNHGSLSFSGDGQRLAVGGGGIVKVWNVRDSWDVSRLHGHTGWILDLAFAPSSRELLTVARIFGTPAQAGGPAWEMKHQDADGGLATRTLPGSSTMLRCAAFNPTADRVALGGRDNTLRICDTATGQELRRIDLKGSPAGLTFGSSGDLLAVLVEEGDVSRIVILDATSGGQKLVLAPGKHLADLALSPDGRIVVAAVVNPLTRELERIQSWSLETGQEGWQGALPPNQFVNVTALAFSPDGRLLAGTTSDRIVTLWDAATGAERFRLQSQANRTGALAFSPDSERLATGGQNGPAKVWDTRTGQVVYSVQDRQGGTYGLAFSADNKTLAVSNGRTVSLLSAETVPSRFYLEGSFRVAVFSPDGRLVAARGPENDILLFDAFTGRRLRSLKRHTQPIASLVFSADGQRLVSLSQQEVFPSDFAQRARARYAQEVRVWDVTTEGQIALFEIQDSSVQRVALSADGSRAAAVLRSSRGVNSNEIHVWDVATRRLLRPIPYEFSAFEALAFTKDGQVVAVRIVTLEELAAAQQALEEGKVVAPPEGKTLAWSVESGTPVKVAGNPFPPRERDQRTADGRRLLLSEALGEFFIQPEPDEPQQQRLLAQVTPDPAWHAEQALGAEVSKQWFAASFHLGRLLLKTPRDVGLLCRRARAFTALERWREARTDCDKAIRLQPESGDAWMLRGLLAYRQGRLEQAHADLSRAAAAAPDDLAVTAWQAFLAAVDKPGGQATAAEQRLLDRLEILRPGGRDWPVSWLGLGSFLQPKPTVPTTGLASWPVLEEELNQRLAENAKAVPFLRLRGLVRAALGKWDTALSDFQEAVRLEPRDLLAWKGVACALWQRPVSGRPGLSLWPPPRPTRECFEACDRVLALDSNAWEFCYLRGLFYAQDGRKDSALEAYTAALKLRHDFVPALRERGHLHAELGRWAEAVEDFTRATEASQAADPSLWDSLALAQLGGGDRAGYRKTCRRTLALFGRTPPQIWAGGALAAGPFNPWAAPLTLHAAGQAASLRWEATATVLACTTLPDTLTDWQPLVPLVEHSDMVRGALFCRMGRHDEAVTLLKRASGDLSTLYLALAEHGRGHKAEAKRLLEESTRWLEGPSPVNPKQTNRDLLVWTARVQIDQLRREVKALLEGKKAP